MVLFNPKALLSNLSPVKKVYILSLAVLGVLLAVTFFRPIATGKEYSTVQKEYIVKTDQGWLIQYNLVNTGETDRSFTVLEAVDSVDICSETVQIPAGGTYVYNHHLFSEHVSQGKVSFTIYRDQEKDPVETLTYHLK